MHWLQSIEKDQEGYLGNFYTLDKEIKQAYLTGRREPSARYPGTFVLSAKLDFTKCQTAPARLYFPLLTEAESAATSHRIFQFSCDGGTVLVPAYVLMKAMGLSNLLFVTKNLAQHGFLDENGEAFFFTPTNSRVALSPHDREYFKFLSAYPSGKHYRHSFHSNLSAGRIDAQLPSALVDAQIRGFASGSNFCVTTMSASTLTALEEPYSIYKNIPATFKLRGSSLSCGYPPSTANNLPFLLGGQVESGTLTRKTPRRAMPKHEEARARAWDLAPAEPEVSDREWGKIRALMCGLGENYASEEMLRRCVESILFWQRTGASWYDFLDGWEKAFVSFHYEKWSKSGFLLDISEKLWELRKQN